MDRRPASSIGSNLIVVLIVLLGTAVGTGAVPVNGDDASVSADAVPVSADEPSSQVTTDDVEDAREDEEEQTDTAADSAETVSEAAETETTTRSPSGTPTATEPPSATATQGPSTPVPSATETSTAANPALEVSNSVITSSTVREGESVTVIVELVNRGERDRQEVVGLRIDGQLVATKGVDIDAGDTGKATFERRFDRPGDHEITVEGTTIGTVTVSTAEDEGSAGTEPTTDRPVLDSEQAEVVAVGGLPDWVRDGFNASVELTVVNRGNTTVTETVEVTVDQEPVANETLRVTPGERTTATIEFLATEGTVRVEGIEAGTLSVGDSWTAVEDSERQATASRGPGFGGVGAVAAIVVAVVALRRRRGRGE